MQQEERKKGRKEERKKQANYAYKKTTNSKIFEIIKKTS